MKTAFSGEEPTREPAVRESGDVQEQYRFVQSTFTSDVSCHVRTSERSRWRSR